jgi:hypothetical protein
MSDTPSELPPSSGVIQPKHGVRHWISRHSQTVGFVLGITASLLAGLVLYWLVESRSRDLSLYVNPTKTTIVKSGQSSDLHVLYKGQSVSTDMTALQVAIWNAGKESIRSEHVLSLITLAASPRVSILEAQIRHVSRPVTNIRLDTTHLVDGSVGVSWKILEHRLKERFGIRSWKPFLFSMGYFLLYVGALWGIHRLLTGSGVPFRFA